MVITVKICPHFTDEAKIKRSDLHNITQMATGPANQKLKFSTAYFILSVHTASTSV